MEPRLLTFNAPDPALPDAPPASTHAVACYQWGNPKAERTIFCVHGLTRNGRDFDFLARALARDFHVLCPDMPGRGKSQRLSNPAGYSNLAYIADCAFILRSLNIARVSWIGTSMGGIMGMMAAATLPGLIDALVLNDIGCLIPAAGLARIRDLSGLQTRFSTRAEAEAAYRLRCAPFHITHEAHWRHLFAHGIEQKDDGSFGYTYDPAIFSAGFSSDAPLADVDLWPLWEKLTPIPMLVIRGAESDILTSATALEMQARHKRLTLHEVPQTGHAPTLMEDKEIALIHEWISAKQETS